MTTSIISLLVVNEVPYLANLAVNSIISNSNSRVAIGYIDEQHVASLPEHRNLIFINLAREASDLGLARNDSYQAYTSKDFFKLVQLKWALFENIFENYEFQTLIYSDLDVVWLESPEGFLNEIFSTDSQVHICIQDSSIRTATKSLCMGFVAFRNSEISKRIIRGCAEDHAKALELSSYSGDDGVITEFYARSDSKCTFYLLPQVSFPIGLLSNLFLDRSPFTGLFPELPFIFHANYLVGAKRKSIMLAYILKISGAKAELPRKLLAELLLRKLIIPMKRFFYKF